jgi:hypothetical protein
MIIKAAEKPTGQREFQMMYQRFPISHIGFRPYISARGATRKGVKPNPRKKTPKAIWPADVLM